jgi:hypothetical protein
VLAISGRPLASSFARIFAIYAGIIMWVTSGLARDSERFRWRISFSRFLYGLQRENKDPLGCLK